MSALEFHYTRGGLHFPKLGLWMDPSRAQSDLTFVSHAHSDHTARHREVVVSEPTAALMHVRLGGRRTEHILPCGEPREFRDGTTKYRLTILPAGHILGSSMALLEADGQSLLYTGDFRLQPGPAAEPCQLREAATLVMETTFGLHRYRFPPPAQVMEDVVRFCKDCLTDHITPVLLAYTLGKGQEVLAGLADTGFRIALHPAMIQLTGVYERFGYTFPPHAPLDWSQLNDRVVICPAGAGRALRGRHGEGVRLAAISGWAMDSSYRYQCGADAAFPLSDHADYPDLIEAVRQVKPRKVFTLHGFAADFAETLRELGYDASPLSEPDQLTLGLGLLQPG